MIDEMVSSDFSIKVQTVFIFDSINSMLKVVKKCEDRNGPKISESFQVDDTIMNVGEALNFFSKMPTSCNCKEEKPELPTVEGIIIDYYIILLN